MLQVDGYPGFEQLGADIRLAAWTSAMYGGEISWRARRYTDSGGLNSVAKLSRAGIIQRTLRRRRSGSKMPQSLQLTSSDTAALFSIDWLSVTGRVAIFKVLGKNAPVYLFKLGALEGDELGPAYYWEDCKSWATITFPALTAHVVAVTAFSSSAVPKLKAIQAQISGLDPNAPLPADMKQAIQAQFQSLAQLAGGLRDSSTALVPLITQFLDSSNAFDAKLKAAALTLEWPALADAARLIEPVLQRALGAWRAIADDLGAVASDKIPMTTELLLSLGIDSAVLAWSNIGAEASKFKTGADAQQLLIAGDWVLSELPPNSA